LKESVRSDEKNQIRVRNNCKRNCYCMSVCGICVHSLYDKTTGQKTIVKKDELGKEEEPRDKKQIKII
jgi:hypothetical protein